MSVSDDLRELVDIARSDQSLVGETLQVFAPKLVQAADEIDRLTVLAKQRRSTARYRGRELRDAKAHVERQGQYIERLKAAVTELAAALNEAADDAEYYAQYYGAYVAQKWGVADDIARYRAIAAKHTPETGP